MPLMGMLVCGHGSPHHLVHLDITQHGHAALTAFPVVVRHGKGLAAEILLASGQRPGVGMLCAAGHALVGWRE